MRILTNTTTARLESYGRARGLDGFGVVKSLDNSAGVFFVTRLGGRVLSRWIALGWTVADAKEAVQRLAFGAEPMPSATGYVAYA